MTHYGGPWYISAAAVRDYLAITRQPAVEDGPAWERARGELIRIAEDTIASSRQPARERSGALRYRGPKPLRLGLIVMPSYVEGRSPQLVRVLPSHNRG